MKVLLLSIIVFGSFSSFLMAETLKFRNFKMEKGFVIRDGSPETQGDLLEPDDILYCEDYCVVVDKEKEIKIMFKGFGRFKNLQNFREVVIGAVAEEREIETKESEPDKKEEPARDKVQEVVLEEEESTVNSRPKSGAVLLHSSGGEISIVPGGKCKTDCSLFINSVVRASYKEDFKAGAAPLVRWEFKAGEEDSVYWKLVDGNEERSGQFEIKKRSSKAVSEALKSDKPVEFIN